jgi:hypothetical protein
MAEPKYTRTREEIKLAIQAKRTCTCLGCGKTYVNKRRSKTEGMKYCSRECAYTGLRVTRALAKAERDAPKQLTADRNRLIRKLLGIMRERARAQHIDELKYTKATTPCAVCGAPCGYVFGRGRKYCSDACHKLSDAFTASRRADKARRRAKERHRKADRIDPIKVFERDGWRCHICKKKLKPEHRGTYKPSAPELDHIIALADGGEHTVGNVACACRACNAAKSSKSFGQLGLPIAA